MSAFSLPHAPERLAAAPSLLSGMLSYQRLSVQGQPIRAFGGSLAPLYFRRREPRRVRCYAIFKWWLLLSQHPRCLRVSTTFATERALRDLRRRSWAVSLLS